MALSQSHGIRAVTAVASPVLNIIWSMGTMAMNENMLSTADSMLNATVMARYFLYGGTKRRSTCRNSFIFLLIYALTSTPLSNRYSGDMSAPLAQNIVPSSPNCTNLSLSLSSS